MAVIDQGFLHILKEMNSQGRGSARFTVVQVVAVLLCLMAVQYVDAATYTVGDSGGWSFNTGKWPNGKQFRAGDVLSKLIDVTAILFRFQVFDQSTTVFHSLQL